MYQDFLTDLNREKEKNYKDFVEATIYTHPYKILTNLYNKVLYECDFDAEKKIQYIESTFLDILTDNKSQYDLKDPILIDRLNEIKKFYWHLYESSKENDNAVMFQSLLFSNFHLLDKIFNQEEMKELNDYDEKIFGNVLKLHNERVIEQKNLSVRDSHTLYTYLLSNLDSTIPSVQQIINEEAKYLMVKNEKLDRYELSFLANYLSKKTWNNIDVPRPYVYISDLNKDLKDKSESKTLGISKTGSRTVVLDESLVGEKFFGDNERIRNYESYADTSVILFHELNHQFQFANVEKEFMTLSAFYLVSTVLIDQIDVDQNKDDDDLTTDYRRNYRFKEIETESNMMAFFYSYYILKQINPSKAEVYKNGQIYFKKKLSKSYQLDEEGKSYEIITYNINMMKQVLKDHPEFYNEYNVLGLIFNRDGSIKTLKQFMLLYANREKDNESLDSLYIYLLKYYIYNSEELGIDFSKVDFNRQSLNFELLSFLQKYVLEEINSIEDILQSATRKDGIEKIEEVVMIKCKSINKALSTIKKQRTTVILDYMSDLFKEDKVGIKRIKEFKETLEELSKKDLMQVYNQTSLASKSMKIGLAIQSVQLSLNDPWINNNKQMMKKIVDVKTFYDKRKQK